MSALGVTHELILDSRRLEDPMSPAATLCLASAKAAPFPGVPSPTSRNEFSPESPPSSRPRPQALRADLIGSVAFVLGVPVQLPAGSESWRAGPMPGRSVPQHAAQAWQKMPPAGAARCHCPALVSLAWKPLFLNQFPNDGQVFDPNLRLVPTVLQ